MNLEDVLRMPLGEILRLAERAAGSKGEQQADRLLTAQEAAQKLRWSPDYLYRNHRRLPFTVREGRHVRFSERAIDEWIRRKAALGEPE